MLHEACFQLGFRTFQLLFTNCAGQAKALVDAENRDIQGGGGGAGKKPKNKLEEEDDDEDEDDAVYDEWVPIKSVKGKPTGRVRVRVQWKPKIYSKKELAARLQQSKGDRKENKGKRGRKQNSPSKGHRETQNSP